MASEKVSLSLDADLLAEARRRAAGRPLSEYVNEGLRRKVLADRQAQLLEEWQAEFGPIPEESLERMADRWPD